MCEISKRDIDLVYSKEILETPRESPWGNTTRDQKLGLEFNKNEYDEKIIIVKKNIGVVYQLGIKIVLNF